MTSNELSLIAGAVILAVAQGDRLELAKQTAVAAQAVDALDLIEAVASISIVSAKAIYGDRWLDELQRALRDVAAQVDREKRGTN